MKTLEHPLYPAIKSEIPTEKLKNNLTLPLCPRAKSVRGTQLRVGPVQQVTSNAIYLGFQHTASHGKLRAKLSFIFHVKMYTAMPCFNDFCSKALPVLAYSFYKALQSSAEDDFTMSTATTHNCDLSHRSSERVKMKSWTSDAMYHVRHRSGA